MFLTSNLRLPPVSVSRFRFQVMQKQKPETWNPKPETLVTSLAATLHDDGLRRHFSLAGSRFQRQLLDGE